MFHIQTSQGMWNFKVVLVLPYIKNEFGLEYDIASYVRIRDFVQIFKDRSGLSLYLCN